ncbi:Putative HC-toxin efflux carrier TOXA [Cytospora mali]|uniref:HC-toxin efflux carrier TOXA n=1 Tax=Cytospora mali TaxID=578113 RepID=A0A194V2V3_CYTMA|nr:Putative HC-toxin efflux carrier TOXA [Valsa mali var. pyri (nom. inval.)]
MAARRECLSEINLTTSQQTLAMSIAATNSDTTLNAEAAVHGQHDPKEDTKEVSAPEQQHTAEEAKVYEYMTGLPFGLVMFAVFLVTFLILLDTSIISTAIPYITDEFHSLTDVGWYGSAYQLASASLQPLTGKIYTLFPSKWCYLVFFTIFEVGSLLCGVASTSTMLIIGRAVAGIGSSGIVNGGLTILANSLPLEKRAIYTGMLLGFSQLGMVIGPIIGGVLTEFSTWRWCFYINLPAGGVAGLMLLTIRIPDHVEKESPKLNQLYHKLDLIGFVLFAPAPIQLLLALHFGEDAWDSPTVIGLLCGSAATFALWLVWNWFRGEAALIPLSLASRRPVWTSAITQMCLATSALISTYFLPIYFQAVQDRKPLISGLQMLPQIVPQIIFAVLGGILVSKSGYPIPYATVGGISVAVGSGLLSLLHDSSPPGQWIGFQVLCGVGRGLGSQMPIVAMQSIITPSEISSAMSLLTFTQSLGTSVFLTVSNTLLDETLQDRLGNLAAEVMAVGATGFRNVQ